MQPDAIHSLALEYIKAHYSIKDLSVSDYFAKYKEIYNELSKLNSDEINKISNECAKAWLRD